MALKVEELTPGARVTGPMGGGHPVTVIQAQWIGGNALRLAYCTLDNRLDGSILDHDHGPCLDLHTAESTYKFRADARLFKRPAKALRVRMASRFAPMLVVRTINLEPSPRQIQADYGQPLARTPLRWQLRSIL